MKEIKSGKRQNGFILIFSIILLIVVAGLIVSAANTSKTNLQITANMQVQREMENVAQRAIEAVLTPTGVSYTYLETPPTTPLSFQAGGSGGTGDTYSATVTVQCLYKGTTAVGQSSRDIGVELQSAPITVYNIRTEVTDPTRSGGKVVINQGVRIPASMPCCSNMPCS